MLTPNVAKAQILFSDNFDHDLSLWETHSTTGKWNIIEKELVGTSENSFFSPHPSYALAGSSEWEDYTLRVKIKGNDRPDKQIIFRVNDDGNYYVLNIVGTYNNSGNNVILAKKHTSDFITNEIDPSFLHSYSYINKPGEWYEVKIDVKNIANSVNINVYIDDTFILEEVDNNNPILQGKIGFEVWPGELYQPSSLTINYFDNVLITKYGYEPVLNLSIENLKQYDPAWSDEEYDHALEWATQISTIEGWGCALTSTVMVLRYYGYSVWPDTLNEWLTSQPDGYIKNGLVNWLAVSRYTHAHTGTTAPTLKFRRYDADSVKLEEDLIMGHPSILEFPGHFVVARGKTSSDFLINDPASESYLLSPLESTRGIYSSINSYIPTDTDLSYIMLIVSGDINISLFDATNHPINTNTYIQEPLKNNLDNSQTSGEKLQILLFPEPQIGIYYIEIKGKEKSFQLDAYMYDQEGNLIGNKYKSISGNISDTSPTFIQFIYSYNSVTYSFIDINDTDEDGVTIGDYCLETTFDIFDYSLGVNRWRWSEKCWNTQKPRGKGKANRPQISYKTTDTFGCSCKQIIDILEMSSLEKLEGHRKFGCSRSILDKFIADMNYNEFNIY